MNIDESISKAKELIYDEQGNFVSYIDLSNDVFDEITTYEQAIETLINEYNNLKQIEEAHRIENGKLREEIKIKDEYLDLIQFMAVDYDREREARGLMELIDQLADYAVKGINCDTKSEIYFGKNILRENIEKRGNHPISIAEFKDCKERKK